MYKVILTHEILPGKLADLKAWFKKQDDARKARNPNYTPFKRYLTVFGSAHEVCIEFETEQLTTFPFINGYAEFGPESQDGAQGEFLKLIVPGCTQLKLVKALDLA